MIININGRTFEQTQEMIETTTRSKPDPYWVFVDKAGHEHRWIVDEPDHHYNLPSLVSVNSEPYWCDLCEDEHSDSHFECKICREIITPGMKANNTSEFVAGLKRYLINGQSVSPETFKEELNKEIENDRRIKANQVSDHLS